MIALGIFFFSFSLAARSSLDLSLVGIVDPHDGLGKITITLAEELSRDLNLSLASTNKVNKELLSKQCRSLLTTHPKKAAVSLFTGVLSYKTKSYTDGMSDAGIKIAYSMFESTRIPRQWVTVLNSQFDAVCVPDSFLVDVYKDSGVTLPIFVIPCPINFKPFINHIPKAKQKDAPFIFGSVARLMPYKNQLLLIDAFMQEFGSDNRVHLVVHGKNGLHDYASIIKKMIYQKGSSNISFYEESLSQDTYIKLVSSFDCYVLVSKGEGYSITPREALCMGIPSIISCNTAHISLGKTGYFYPVESSILERPKHFTTMFGQGDYGYQFNCSVQDVKKALRDVYEHYGYWKYKALEGKKRIDYDITHIRQKFITLVKPKKVVFGSVNSIDGSTINTTSKSLYKKYLQFTEL